MCGNIPEDAPRMHIEGLLARYQEQAMRTLGFAYAIIGADEPCPIYEDAVHCSQLTFIAMAAIADPVRADVPEAIREVIGAGVAIKIVTCGTMPPTPWKRPQSLVLILKPSAMRNYAADYRL